MLCCAVNAISLGYNRWNVKRSGMKKSIRWNSVSLPMWAMNCVHRWRWSFLRWKEWWKKPMMNGSRSNWNWCIVMHCGYWILWTNYLISVKMRWQGCIWIFRRGRLYRMFTLYATHSWCFRKRKTCISLFSRQSNRWICRSMRIK